MTVKDRSRLDDHYSRQARREGYPARSVYKLSEIDQKFKLLRPGLKVLELGCAPGGWSLYLAGRLGPAGRLVGLDLQETSVHLSPPQAVFITGDFFILPPASVQPYGPFDLVLSDLAPSTTGRRETDQARSLELVSRAWLWAEELLKPGGHFLFKIFQSPEGDALARRLELNFQKITFLKPRAVRPRSQEIFVLAHFFINVNRS